MVQIRDPYDIHDQNPREIPLLTHSPNGNAVLSPQLIQLYTSSQTPLSVIIPRIEAHQFHSLVQYDEMHQESEEEHPITTMLSESTGGPCGATWTVGQIAFKCKTCEKDPTCAICKDCFVNGDHEGHDYALTTTSSGMCDCGDPESWDERGFCENHKRTDDMGDATSHLPWDVKEVTRETCRAYAHLLFVQIMQVYNLVHERQLLEELDAKLHGFRTDAIYLCSILVQKVHDFPCYQRLFGEALAQCFNEERYDGQCILDMILQRFSELPLDVASSVYELLAVLIPDAESKKLISRLYCKHYRSIMTAYCDEYKLDEDTSHISSMSVQLFTVPAIANELTFHHNLLENMIATLMEVSVKSLSREETPTSVLSPTASALRSPGFWHLMVDFSYILMQPTVCEYFFTNEDIFHNFVTFLSFFQSCSEVRRIDSDESEWQNTFSWEMRCVKRILDHFDTCIDYLFQNRGAQRAMHILFKDVVPLLCAYLGVYLDSQESMKHTAIDEFGVKHIEFNLVQGPVNFHFPLHKVLAQIVHSAVKSNPQFSLRDIFGDTSYGDKDFLLKLLENPLRCFVISSHIRRRLWPRDNMQVLEQTLNYESTWLDYTVCNDMYLVQNLAPMLGNTTFLATVLSRFKNTEELFGLNMPTDPITLGLEEDTLRFLLTVFTHRVYSGTDADDSAKLFILHELFQGAKPFSEITNAIPKKFRGSIETLLQEVATQTADSSFVVKKEMWKYFNPYFISMSPREVELALQNFVSVCRNEPLVLMQPGPIDRTLESLLTLLHDRRMHYILFVILYRTCKQLAEGKAAPSDRSLTIALHAIVYIVDSMSADVVKGFLDSEVHIPGTESNVNLLLNLHHPFLANAPGDEHAQSATILSLLIEVFKNPECRDQRVFLQKRLFPLLSEWDATTRDILALYLVENEDASKQKKKKRSTKAKRRTAKILERFKKQQQQFDERAFLGDDMDIEPEEDELCCFCHAPGTSDKKLSVLAQISKSSAVSLVNDLNMQDYYDGGFDENSDVNPGHIPPQRMEADQSSVYVNSVNAHNNINISEGIQVNTCGHRCHSACFQSYYLSLLSTRRFKGSHLLDLDNMEIMCPICSSILNVMLPLLDEDESDIVLRGHCSEDCEHMHDDEHFQYDDLWSVLAGSNVHHVPLTASDQSDVISLRDKITSFSSGEDCITDLVAYNIASREVAQRGLFDTLETFSQKDRDLIQLLIRCVSAIRMRDENTDQTTALILQSLRGDSPNESYEDYEMSNEDTFLPILSCDMFSVLVRLLILRPALRTWGNVQCLVELLYCVNVLQCILVLTCRMHETHFSHNSLQQLVVKFAPLSGLSVPNYIQIPEGHDVSLATVEGMTLLFLRRASLFVSAYFDKKQEIPLPLDTEFNALRDYLNLPLLDDVLKGMLQPGHVLEQYASKWISQLKTIISLNEREVHNLVPRFTKPAPFHFIALPTLFQTLYLHFVGKGCETCHQAYDLPTLSLTDGKLIGMRRACRCHPSSPGGVARHAMIQQSGQGVYLSLKHCVLLVMGSSGRHAFVKSMYRDKFGEVDENLRRGKPLFLDRTVLKALEPKFLLNQFDQDSMVMVSVDARSTRGLFL